MIYISIGEWPKNSGIKSYSQRVFKLEQSQEVVVVSLLLKSNVIATNACSCRRVCSKNITLEIMKQVPGLVR